MNATSFSNARCLLRMTYSASALLPQAFSSSNDLNRLMDFMMSECELHLQYYKSMLGRDLNLTCA